MLYLLLLHKNNRNTNVSQCYVHKYVGYLSKLEFHITVDNPSSKLWSKCSVEFDSYASFSSQIESILFKVYSKMADRP